MRKKEEKRRSDSYPICLRAFLSHPCVSPQEPERERRIEEDKGGKKRVRQRKGKREEKREREKERN
jgi:hypothetical protein